METKYRLLGIGERPKPGCEWLTPAGVWLPVVPEWRGLCETDPPVRIADDGSGEYELTDEIGGDAFWKWGVGWVKMPGHIPSTKGVVWRKKRGAVPPGLWVLVPTECRRFSSWEEACADAKAQARATGDGAEFAVCRVDRTFRCSVEVVEREVGK